MVQCGEKTVVRVTLTISPSFKEILTTVFSQFVKGSEENSRRIGQHRTVKSSAPSRTVALRPSEGNTVELTRKYAPAATIAHPKTASADAVHETPGLRTTRPPSFSTRITKPW